MSNTNILKHGLTNAQKHELLLAANRKRAEDYALYEEEKKE